MAAAAAPFTPVDHVLEGRVASGTFINVIGIVIDFRAPIPTKKTDYKAQIRFYDESAQDVDSKSLTLNVFRGRDAMPNPACGDVVVILRAKVQTYNFELSLMTNYQTDIYVFTALNIPKPPQGAEKALHPIVKKPSRVLTGADFVHVSAFYHRIDKDRVPTAAEYHHKFEASVQVKEKFSLLRDVACDRFVDVIAEVVKQPYDLGDKFTLWISDYTEHANFFNFIMEDLDSHTRPGPRNSAVGSNAADSDWCGPYGKHSLQITCWEPHAAAIRANNISVGSWVFIKNLQIKYGRNSSNLEGFLRGDQEFHSKINISVLENLDDADAMDPRLLDTIRRRLNYEKEKKSQLKSIREAAKAGQKRRAALEDDSKPRKSNSKARRNEKRQAAKNVAVSATNPEHEKSPTPEAKTSKIKLNSIIKCENEKQPLSTVAELLEQIYFETLISTDAAKLPLPFINANYRASVRVKNYLPHRLEDFTFAKLKGDIYDVLSDAESDSSDNSEDMTMDRFVTSERIAGWAWRFHLLLEDARDTDDAEQKDEVWVTVDNHAAQCLLNMNACDLNHSKSEVAKLREKLFYLWGDLEEQKTKKLQRKAKAGKQARTNAPPADSDDEGPSSGIVPANRPFSCCIKQYGVKMREADEAKADAGEGRRWQRMYGLFGTQISVPDVVRTE
ncbi:telomere-binding alpha subunit central domain protein [Akanthomyces lecanii RCEF 1005]|uniref:Protection of telomeres protein 1 n=1 Tax=Akanthomyces lecanii RCEF 1005 TaxID=1081108 RepID=A0A162K3S1_CORDF|nr:telomere-binding alpha subunit central domain protein [Akanthomyces lecanii RCEF 1005]